MQASENTIQYPTKPWNWDAPISFNLNLNPNPKLSVTKNESNGSTIVTNGINGHNHNNDRNHLPSHNHTPHPNNIHGHNTPLKKDDDQEDPPTLTQLESELPFTDHEQIPLGEILSRVVQDVYAELATLADTLPSSSDAARKRMLADFVVKHKKQVVKLYAVIKWAKDARDIQLCMNIVTFLLGTNMQLQEVTNALELAKTSLAPAKLRNHDLLTSLDVLTTGTYQRLPTGIKRFFIPKPQLTTDEIFQTLTDYDHLIRYRLKTSEIIPVEMNKYHVSQAQAHFHVPNLFRVSLSLRGSELQDAWFLTNIEFDFKVGGDDTGVVEFPRIPTGVVKQHIVVEADARLALYSYGEEMQNFPGDDGQSAGKEKENDGKETKKEQAPTTTVPPSSVPKLPLHVVDAPLVRLHNLLQMLSLSYQLEILHYQAQRMRSLGWGDFLKVSLAKNRQSLTVSYWIRPAPPPRPANAPQLRTKTPLLGGTIVISISDLGVSQPAEDKGKNKKSTSGGPISRSISQNLSTSSSITGTASSSSLTSNLKNTGSVVTHGVVVQHPPGRSHVDKVLHELSLIGKLRRRTTAATASGLQQTDPIGETAAVGESNLAGAGATPHAMKDSVSTPRPGKEKESISTPRVSPPRPTAASGSGLTQTQSFATTLTQTHTQSFPQVSDDIERLHLSVKWTPESNALGFMTNPTEWVRKIDVDAADLDFQSLLMKILRKQSEAILKVFRRQLVEGPHRNVFGENEVVMGFEPDSTPTLSIHLCASEQVVVTIDPRTGKFALRDTGDLTSAGRGPRFASVSEKINENPVLVLNAIVTLRYNTIMENAEQKAIALGLRTFRHRSLSREGIAVSTFHSFGKINTLSLEMAKFGPSARACLFIQLHHFRTNYLVLVVAEEEFNYALVSVKGVDGGNLWVMDDIGWLDVKRVRGSVRVGVGQNDEENGSSVIVGMKRKAAEELVRGGSGKEKKFNLEFDVIKELYAYCCARVAHTRIEQQLKSRGIPYTHVSSLFFSAPSPSQSGAGIGMSLGMHPSLAMNNTLFDLNGIPLDPSYDIHSSLAASVPILCVQSKDILSGVPAAEAAMPNIRIVPINWWSSERKCQVVTCVKLKYVQPPVGVDKASAAATVIRPSKSVIYDTREAIVSFLSDNIDTCVDEFLDGWARVSTIVVIAREVSQMAKKMQWNDVRLLSFDLQTVEFTYTTGYALSISCTHQQQATEGLYRLQFSRVNSSDGPTSRGRRAPGVTLHDEASPFLRPLLRTGRLAQSLKEIVEMLRDTLPMTLELEKLIQCRKKRDDDDSDDMDLDEKEMDDGGGGGSSEHEQFRGVKVDVYPKAFAWYRVLFGDLRHALDFRLLSRKRVGILDASQSLFDPPPTSSLTISSPSTNDKDTGPQFIGVLEPIPDFKNILTEVAESARGEGWSKHLGSSGIALIDIGIICDANVAGKVGLAVFKRIIERLGKKSIKVEEQ
ncbi:hypothetical protein Clacol_000856 [Clathrus columnatus]|uniref:Mediator of RNA polymerase II transcription subunit 14 n=1 Tax=Clathrus columnatus TaxID=1419009 RepID=A0AAV4ZX92_9AGAM|nr:hypothetical protein Clacol_000856 [Clathrus columnatus]